MLHHCDPLSRKVSQVHFQTVSAALDGVHNPAVSPAAENTVNMGQTQSDLWLMLMLYDSLPWATLIFDTLLINEGPEYSHALIVNIFWSAD